jgi:hypothetical protein
MVWRRFAVGVEPIRLLRSIRKMALSAPSCKVKAQSLLPRPQLRHLQKVHELQHYRPAKVATRIDAIRVSARPTMRMTKSALFHARIVLLLYQRKRRKMDHQVGLTVAVQSSERANHMRGLLHPLKSHHHPSPLLPPIRRLLSR